MNRTLGHSLELKLGIDAYRILDVIEGSDFCMNCLSGALSEDACARILDKLVSKGILQAYDNDVNDKKAHDFIAKKNDKRYKIQEKIIPAKVKKKYKVSDDSTCIKATHYVVNLCRSNGKSYKIEDNAIYSFCKYHHTDSWDNKDSHIFVAAKDLESYRGVLFRDQSVPVQADNITWFDDLDLLMEKKFKIS